MQAVLVGGSGGTAREAVRESSAQWHSQLVAAGIVGTKRQRLKDYADSFYGSDFITWCVMRFIDTLARMWGLGKGKLRCRDAWGLAVTRLFPVCCCALIRLVRSGRCQSREEGLQFGEALRERDILHHVNDQHKFKDDKLIYRMRAVEGIEGDGSTLGPTVPQLLNQSRYMMGAWFLKQVWARVFPADLSRSAEVSRCIAGSRLLEPPLLRPGQTFSTVVCVYQRRGP